ncbi:MAG: FMN-binding protein [Mycobacteriales bacterium]
MTSDDLRRARRNASVVGATGLSVGALFLFPSSTNRTGPLLRHPGVAAPTGIVTEPAASPQPAATQGAPPAAPVRTVNGAAIDTQYGPVQVQVRIRAQRIISAVAIAYPQGSDRDLEINSYAIPLLERETIAAQSAKIDTVSGASYTSDGYVGSLQSALDAASR